MQVKVAHVCRIVFKLVLVINKAEIMMTRSSINQLINVVYHMPSS